MTTNNNAPVRQMLHNFALLLSGRGVAAILGLLATMIMARALPATEFGMVILVHTYVLLLRGLLNAKPFEAVVRYGVNAEQAPAAFRHLLRFTLTVDWLGALLATALAALLAQLASGWLQLPQQAANMATLYAGILLLSATGTAKGLLRLHGKFALLGVAQALAPAMRLLVFIICYYKQTGPGGYLLGFGLGLALEYGFLLITGNQQARAQQLPQVPGSFRWQTLQQQHPGLWRLLNAVYWQSNLDLIPKHASTLLAGGLLGSAAAGYFRIAREFASVLSEPATLLRQAVFPDLARLRTHDHSNSGKRQFGRTVAMLSIYALLPGLALVALAAWQGEWLIAKLASAEYLPAAPLLVALLLAATASSAGGVLRVANYAADRALSVLSIAVVAQLGYLLALLLLGPRLGLMGFGYAAIIAAFIDLCGSAWVLRRQLNSERGSDSTAPR